MKHKESPPCPCDDPVPSALVVPIDLNECFAIGNHFDPARGTRTNLGDLLHAAKSYDTKPGERSAADRLGACMAWWAAHLARIRNLSFGRVQVVCSMPANPPKLPYNLPDLLAGSIARSLGVPYEPQLLVKNRMTDQIKYATDKASKVMELWGAFTVTRDLNREVVLVVDDLVLSGATLEEVARALRARGASKVLGLAATRATKGLNT